MRNSVCALILLLAAQSLLPTNAPAQERRLLVVSSRVGNVINSVERSQFKLFISMRDFRSASFYQAPDSSFQITFARKLGARPLPDSTCTISYNTLCEYAEWIWHRKEIERGTYELGSTRPPIYFADGALLKVPSLPPREQTTARTKGLADALPLARNTANLPRPIFHTIHVDLAFGIAFADLSELGPLGITESGTYVPFNVYVEIPLSEDPLISVMGGGSIFTLGSTSSFSMYFLYRTSSSRPFTAIFGLGAGRTGYSGGQSILVSAAQSYVALAVGLSIVPNSLDLLFTVPLTASMQTTFEKKHYSISLNGPQLSLLISL